MEPIRATDGKNDKINQLGIEMAKLFSKEYAFLSEKERIKTFFSAIKSHAHNNELMSYIKSEARYLAS